MIERIKCDSCNNKVILHEGEILKRCVNHGYGIYHHIVEGCDGREFDIGSNIVKEMLDE